MMMDGGWGGYGGYGGIGSIFGMIFMIAIIVGVVLLIVWLVRQVGGAPRTGGAAETVTRGETALDILKSRYARGEIDKAEFEEKKKDLTG